MMKRRPEISIAPRRSRSHRTRETVSISSRQNADCHSRILRCRKSSAARAKVARGKLVANFRRPRLDVVKAVITHLGLPFGKPSAYSSLRFPNSRLINSLGRFAHERYHLHLLFPFAWIEISEGQPNK
jgi:hypothetical protein